jgi:hypothetical protein
MLKPEGVKVAVPRTHIKPPVHNDWSCEKTALNRAARPERSTVCCVEGEYLATLSISVVYDFPGNGGR